MKADEASLFARVSFDCFQSIYWVLCDGEHFPSLLKDADSCSLQLTPLTPTSHPPKIVSETPPVHPLVKRVMGQERSQDASDLLSQCVPFP